MKTNLSPFLLTNINRSLTGLIFLLSFSSLVISEEINTSKSRISEQWQTASNSELDSLRGGFTLSNGMVMDFSFEKIIFKNGVETSSTYFELPTTIPFTQVGAMNFARAFSDALLHSVIQNSLNNQVIRTVNTVNIDIRTVEAFRNALSPTFR